MYPESPHELIHELALRSPCVQERLRKLLHINGPAFRTDSTETQWVLYRLLRTPVDVVLSGCD